MRRQVLLLAMLGLSLIGVLLGLGRVMGSALVGSALEERDLSPLRQTAVPDRAVWRFAALSAASPSSTVRASGFSSHTVVDTRLARKRGIAPPGGRAAHPQPTLPLQPPGAQSAPRSCPSAGLPHAAPPLSLGGHSLACHHLHRVRSLSGIEAALRPSAALAALAFAVLRLRVPTHCSPYRPEVVVPPG
jgi:hypothetical protein